MTKNKTQTILARVTPAQHTKLLKHIKANKQTISEWVRDQIDKISIRK